MMAGFDPPLRHAMTDSLPDQAPTSAEPAAAPTAEAAHPARPANGPRTARRGRRGAGRGARPARPDAAPAASQPDRPAAPRRSHPLLERLAALYPRLFGEAPAPLKRGIFEDLLAAHGADLEPEALKAALALHTRSTRYLSAMASGQPRRDLQGRAVEPVAPEHQHHALLEVFRRRKPREGEDPRAKLRERLLQAFEASGLTREAYAERVRGRDESANALLDEALAEAAARAAKDEALLRAFEASGQAVSAFAELYGLDPRAAERTLARARRRRQAVA